MRLRIGHLSTFYHTSILMIARDTMGAEAEWKLYGTGPAIVNAFEKGDLDLAYIGLPPAVIGIDRGIDIKCIAGGHIEGTVICGRKEFKGYPEIIGPGEILKQFAGHKIGVPGKGSIHDVIISEMLREFNLNSDIKIINYPWADRVLDALHNGEVSAAVGTPALAVAVMRYADGRILLPPSMLWPANPSYGILVRSALITKAGELIENFLILHEEAASFIRNSPEEAARIISDYVKVADKEFVMDTLKISPKYCSCITDEYIASTMEFVKILRRLRYIKRDIPSGEIFDTSLITKTHPSADHYKEGISADS